MLMNGVLCVGTLSFNSKKEKLSELTEKKVFLTLVSWKWLKWGVGSDPISDTVR